LGCLFSFFRGVLSFVLFLFSPAVKFGIQQLRGHGLLKLAEIRVIVQIEPEFSPSPYGGDTGIFPQSRFPELYVVIEASTLVNSSKLALRADYEPTLIADGEAYSLSFGIV
jgi:hypothetical protein